MDASRERSEFSARGRPALQLLGPQPPVVQCGQLCGVVGCVLSRGRRFNLSRRYARDAVARRRIHRDRHDDGLPLALVVPIYRGASHRSNFPLFLAYFTFLPQIIGSILYFAHTEQTSRNAELIWIAMPALILTTIVSAVLPAIGPYVHYFGRETADIVVLTSLRTGGAQTFVVSRMQGIITFPSFHTILAIAFIYVHRPPSRSFVPVAILNGLMLLAIPSEGHHYLIDVISGAAVAAVCIAVVRAGMRPRSDNTMPIISRAQMPRVVR